MLRLTSVLSAFVLAACASTRLETPAVRGHRETPRADASTEEFLMAPGEPTRDPPASSAACDLETRLDVVDHHSPLAGLHPAQTETRLRHNRFTIKGGHYGSAEESIDDDGYTIHVSSLSFLNNWLAIESELGYLDAEGTAGGVETEVWAIPLMVNGRVTVPVRIVDIYGGLGIGTFYYDAKATGGPARVDADGWLLAGSAFVGASIILADKVALGLEAKYYVTDEMNHSGEGLDAFAMMLTVGFGL